MLNTFLRRFQTITRLSFLVGILCLTAASAYLLAV